MNIREIDDMLSGTVEWRCPYCSSQVAPLIRSVANAVFTRKFMLSGGMLVGYDGSYSDIEAVGDTTDEWVECSACHSRIA